MNAEFVERELQSAAADGGKLFWNRLPGRDEPKFDAIIEASAGTGKTYTLERVALKLTKEYGEDFINRILIVTFTEKAAGELRDRIRAILAKAGMLSAAFNDATICTIHSFCRELLTQYAFENRVAMSHAIESGDSAYVEQALRDVLCGDDPLIDGIAAKTALERDGSAMTFALETFLAGRGRKKSLAPAQMLGWLRKQAKDALAGKPDPQMANAAQTQPALAELKAIADAIAEKARQAKKAKGVLTFDDLVQNAAAIIAEEAEKEAAGQTSRLLNMIREKYRVALVDEFQDTDDKQWTIFRSIFSSRNFASAPNSEQGFLIVVGDPKQAIYSFRGADVKTYLRAKGEIVGRGRRHALNCTYRSSPQMIETFNRFFGEGWFDAAGDGSADTGSIGYEAVEYPAGNEKFRGYVDRTGRAALTLLESFTREPEKKLVRQYGYGSQAKCMPVFARAAAAEIRRLANLECAYETADDAGNIQRHRYEYRDICILVRDGSTAEIVIKALRESRIPFGYYKERGIYSGVEAAALAALFAFLAEPWRGGNLAALYASPLFGVGPCDLAAALRSEDPARRQLTDRWQEFARRGDWTALAESVMNDSLLGSPAANDFEYDRRWTTFRQILDELISAARGQHLAAADLAALLRRWAEDPARSGEDGALRRKDSDANRVQVMTMHASKGLEFKVVFLAYGFKDYLRKAEPDAREDTAREERRLLYVAITRAAHKIYLPWSRWAAHRRAADKDDSVGVEENGIGSRGAALLDPDGRGFLAAAIRRTLEALPQTQILSRREIEREAAAAPERGGGPEENKIAPAQRAAVAVYAPESLKGRVVAWDSFTSINRRGAKAAPEPAEDAKERDESDAPPIAQEAPLLKRGAAAGTAFHEIMEDLCNSREEDGLGFGIGNSDFAALCTNEKFIRIIRRKMAKNLIADLTCGDESTAKVFARMAWSALRKEIAIGGETFRLADVAAADRRAEVAFVADEPETLGAAAPALRREGVFNGSIDLLVRPRGRTGKTYLLDWKTNALDAYDERTVAAAMEEEGYHLQHELYSLAVERWLGRGKLGGVAYVFVRGAADPGGECGVFARAADDAALENARGKIAALLL